MTEYITCDACGWTMGGYTKRELQAEGWVFHVIKKGEAFVVCDTCEAMYEQRREAKAPEAA